MIIRVTNADIKKGARRDAGACPIALAIQRRFPDSTICVWHDILEIDDKLYRPTDRIVKFVIDFDNGLPVKPFSFHLDKLVPAT